MTEAKYPLLQIRDLTIDFAVNKAWIPAVRGIDLDLAQGEVLAWLVNLVRVSRLWPCPCPGCWQTTPD